MRFNDGPLFSSLGFFLAIRPYGRWIILPKFFSWICGKILALYFGNGFLYRERCNRRKKIHEMRYHVTIDFLCSNIVTDRRIPFSNSLDKTYLQARALRLWLSGYLVPKELNAIWPMLTVIFDVFYGFYSGASVNCPSFYQRNRGTGRAMLLFSQQEKSVLRLFEYWFYDAGAIQRSQRRDG